MTQHGTSVVIKQTNDGLGSAELRLLEMLQVVTRDKKKRNKRKKQKDRPSISEEVIQFRVWGAGVHPSMYWATIVYRNTHAYCRELYSFLDLTRMLLDCGKQKNKTKHRDNMQTPRRKSQHRWHNQTHLGVKPQF